MGLFDFDNTPDWVNTNESDGATFYGYDDGEGRTDWYDSDGNLREDAYNNVKPENAVDGNTKSSFTSYFTRTEGSTFR